MKKILMLTLVAICLVIFTSVGVNASITSVPCENCGWGTTVYTEGGYHTHGTDPYDCHHGFVAIPDFMVENYNTTYYECTSCHYQNYYTSTYVGYTWGCGLDEASPWCPYCGDL